MALRSQKQLMAELDRMNGRRIAEIGEKFQEGVVGPLVDTVKAAKSLKGLLRALGPGLVKRMDTAGLEDAVADTMIQAGLIGRVSALPRRKDEGGRRKDEGGMMKDGS
jgi:hypothetical protein